jgi:hypothetical protein
MATSHELQQGIEQVRNAIAALDIDAGQAGSEGARDLGIALDNLRRTFWAVLTTKHSGDFDNFLARIRLRRATEICEGVLADLYAGAVTSDSPGLFYFHAALTDVSRQLEEIAS